MPSPKFNSEALIRAAVEAVAAQGKSVDGFTSTEFRESNGYTESNGKRVLREMFAHGLIQFRGKRRAFRMDGVSTLVPVYQFTNKARSLSNGAA